MIPRPSLSQSHPPKELYPPHRGAGGGTGLGVSLFEEVASFPGDNEGGVGVATALVRDGQWPGAQCMALALPLHFRCSVQTGQCQLRPIPLPHCYNPFKGTEPAFGAFVCSEFNLRHSVQDASWFLHCRRVCLYARVGMCVLGKEGKRMSGGRKRKDGEESQRLWRDYFPLMECWFMRLKLESLQGDRTLKNKKDNSGPMLLSLKNTY